ncbi:MAG: hypothetical protein H7835_20345 [Magnetococcus sp. XQGC-1]
MGSKLTPLEEPAVYYVGAIAMSPTSAASVIAGHNNNDETHRYSAAAAVAAAARKTPYSRATAAAAMENTSCKICTKRKVNVVILPCTHLSTCERCSVLLTDCPVCRGEFAGFVKAQIVGRSTPPLPSPPPQNSELHA